MKELIDALDKEIELLDLRTSYNYDRIECLVLDSIRESLARIADSLLEKGE